MTSLRSCARCRTGTPRWCLGVLRSLDLERLLGRERSRERDQCLAMICQPLIGPGSKLSLPGLLSQTMLADELDPEEVKEAELLAAMDWLLERQDRIERSLARRHLQGEFVLYDLSSSYLKGPPLRAGEPVKPGETLRVRI